MSEKSRAIGLSVLGVLGGEEMVSAQSPEIDNKPAIENVVESDSFRLQVPDLKISEKRYKELKVLELLEFYGIYPADAKALGINLEETFDTFVKESKIAATETVDSVSHKSAIALEYISPSREEIGKVTGIKVSINDTPMIVAKMPVGVNMIKTGDRHVVPVDQDMKIDGGYYVIPFKNISGEALIKLENIQKPKLKLGEVLTSAEGDNFNVVGITAGRILLKTKEDKLPSLGTHFYDKAGNLIGMVDVAGIKNGKSNLVAVISVSVFAEYLRAGQNNIQ